MHTKSVTRLTNNSVVDTCSLFATYPGVYIQELPSSARAITGVATSITAFVGRALNGPTDKALTIHSFADFQRLYRIVAAIGLSLVGIKMVLETTSRLVLIKQPNKQ